MYNFGQMSFQVLCPFFNWVACLLSCKHSLSGYLDTRHLVDTWFANIFSFLFSHFFDNVFCCIEFFLFEEVQFLCFFFFLCHFYHAFITKSFIMKFCWEYNYWLIVFVLALWICHPTAFWFPWFLTSSHYY